jgi:ABC-2 type transport system ATP-binding protein
VRTSTAGAPAIRTEGLTKRYGPVVGLDALDLQVQRGEVFGYLGPNGAGKTTTIRLLLGMLRPTAGRAEVLGIDAVADPRHAHRRLAYVAGDVALWPGLTGEETLHLLGRMHGSFDRAYRDELVQRFELDPSRRVRAYSKGNRQKLALIGALMTRADLLVLDEPTAGLDPLMEQVFRACVREAAERGQTVFLSSHLLSEVEALCAQVAILRAGRLVAAGTLADMRWDGTLAVEASFDGERAVPDVSAVPGVLYPVVDGTVLRCRVSGPVAPLLAALAAAGAVRVVSREPTLEELFLAHYQQQ